MSRHVFRPATALVVISLCHSMFTTPAAGQVKKMPRIYSSSNGFFDAIPDLLPEKRLLPRAWVPRVT